jgi:hypothetical protein
VIGISDCAHEARRPRILGAARAEAGARFHPTTARLAEWMTDTSTAPARSPRG